MLGHLYALQSKLMKTARKMMILLAVARSPSPTHGTGELSMTGTLSVASGSNSLIRATKPKSNQNLGVSESSSKPSSTSVSHVHDDEFDAEAALRVSQDVPLRKNSLANQSTNWTDPTSATNSRAASAFAGALLRRHQSPALDDEDSVRSFHEDDSLGSGSGGTGAPK